MAARGPRVEHGSGRTARDDSLRSGCVVPRRGLGAQLPSHPAPRRRPPRGAGRGERRAPAGLAEAARCLRQELMAASAMTEPPTASCRVHGEGRSPATSWVNAPTSVRNAPANRAMKNSYGSPGTRCCGRRRAAGYCCSDPPRVLCAAPGEVATNPVLAPFRLGLVLLTGWGDSVQ
jgi:hypothetical protein